MRVALAAIFQLTNTFSRQLTTADDFGRTGKVDHNVPKCDPSGVLRLAEAITQGGVGHGIVIVPVLTTVARSSGPVTNVALEMLTNRLSDGLKDAGPDLDALILVLSGTMITENWGSADLALIQTARSALKPGTPIIAVFSSQANLSDTMVNAVDVPLGFWPEPVSEIERAAKKILRVTAGLVLHDSRPFVAFRKLRLLVPLIQQAPASDPLRAARTMAREFEAESGVIDVGLFPAFPHSDVQHAGFSLLVTSEGDHDQANSLAQRVHLSIWAQRGDFASMQLNVETAVHEAMLHEKGTVVIADSGDDPAAGGSGDGTGLLWALIDLGARDAALGVIVDPAGVARAIEAGVGNEIHLDLGGSIDHRAGYPINITATVRRVSVGRLNLGDRCSVSLGRAVVLDVEGRHGGRIDVIVTEKQPDTIEPDLFGALGIDIATKKIVGVKKSMEVAAAFGHIAARVLQISTPGITTPVLSYFSYQRVPRPICPLDSM